MVARMLSVLMTALATLACGEVQPRLTFSGSAVGAEGQLIRQQLTRFAALHPEIPVEVRVTPDAADQRHQLYVQWLNARAPEPDVLQLDVVWTAEFAAAGWIAPLEQPTDADDFFTPLIEADRWQARLYAVPWFVDVGLLYWRTDLLAEPPRSLTGLREAGRAAVRSGRVRNGLVWQGARYEGLTTVFLEHVTAFGGGVLDSSGAVIVDQPAAVRALTFMRDSIRSDALVPAAVLAWQEEHTRFSFQAGQAAFMRNWPYAWPLLQNEEDSRVAGHVGVIPFPAGDGGRASAALGGAQLAINKYSRHPDLARALVEFLIDPAQMLERARVVGQLPPRRSLYESAALATALSMPLADIRRALESAVARPITPVYTELSELLQVHLHRALSGQEEPDAALRAAAVEIRGLLARSGLAVSAP